MGAILLITQILGVAAKEIIPIEDLVARLKNIFTLDPNAQVNIQNLASEAIQADDDTLTMIANWQTANGLPVTVQPPAPAPTPIVQTPAASSQTPAAAQATPAATVTMFKDAHGVARTVDGAGNEVLPEKSS